MCGRFALYGSAENIAEKFAIEQTFFPIIPRYNIAPSQVIAAVTQSQERELRPLKWGLVPSWVKNPAFGNRMINARAESLKDKPSFKRAFRARRCIIPASGYYEWKKTFSGTKTPYYIQLQNKELFAMAGLQEEWTGATKEVLHTCAIVTTEANDSAATVHNRMPAILSADEVEQWLNPDSSNVDSLLELLHPYKGKLRIHPVASKVNYVDRDNASCIDPVSVEKELQHNLEL